MIFYSNSDYEFVKKFYAVASHSVLDISSRDQYILSAATHTDEINQPRAKHWAKLGPPSSSCDLYSGSRKQFLHLKPCVDKAPMKLYK